MGHVLVSRAEPRKIRPLRKEARVQRALTTLQHTAVLLPPAQRPLLYAPRFPPGSRQDPTGGVKKEDAAAAFKTWFADRASWDITVFSDGSRTEDGIGYGYVIYEGQQRVAEGQGGLDACSVVYDAEALGALRGLERETNLYPDALVTLCVDNAATI